VHADLERPLELTKHEGAGNDFLVLADSERRIGIDAEMVRAVCDRHRGVGADGLIRLGGSREGADVSMELWNADGSVAEMSGNGIRCLVQAAVDVQMASPPTVTVATAAGVKTVCYRPAQAWAAVDMGVVRLGGERTDLPDAARARAVDAGNPHVVVWSPTLPSDPAVAGVGARLDAETPGGTNVEFIAPGEAPGELLLRVWERGVGETLACGTGSCAAAAAARAWGLVGDRVRVCNPGGVLEVTLGAGPLDPVVLGGPVHRVARVLLDPKLLDAN
jgi:diaminopimelate epimerase